MPRDINNYVKFQLHRLDRPDLNSALQHGIGQHPNICLERITVQRTFGERSTSIRTSPTTITDVPQSKPSL